MLLPYLTLWEREAQRIGLAEYFMGYGQQVIKLRRRNEKLLNQPSSAAHAIISWEIKRKRVNIKTGQIFLGQKYRWTKNCSSVFNLSLVINILQIHCHWHCQSNYKTLLTKLNYTNYPMLKEIRIKIFVESVCKINRWRLPVYLNHKKKQ